MNRYYVADGVSMLPLPLCSRCYEMLGRLLLTLCCRAIIIVIVGGLESQPQLCVRQKYWSLS